MATSTEAGSTSQSVHDTESVSSVALSQREDSTSEAEENDGAPKLTTKWLLNFFSKDWKHYYRTFELNEALYLHFKGKLKGNFPNSSPNPPTLQASTKSNAWSTSPTSRLCTSKEMG